MKKTIAFLLACILVLGLAACTEPEPPYAPQEVTLYLPGDNADGFTVATAETDGSPGHVVTLLVEHGALPRGTALLSFDAEEGLLDMNAAFAEALSQTGTAGEYMMLGCLVNTLLAFYRLDSVSITAQGETLQTGHEIYDYPLAWFE